MSIGKDITPGLKVLDLFMYLQWRIQGLEIDPMNHELCPWHALLIFMEISFLAMVKNPSLTKEVHHIKDFTSKNNGKSYRSDMIIQIIQSFI